MEMNNLEWLRQRAGAEDNQCITAGNPEYFMAHIKGFKEQYAEVKADLLAHGADAMSGEVVESAKKLWNHFLDLGVTDLELLHSYDGLVIIAGGSIRVAIMEIGR